MKYLLDTHTAVWIFENKLNLSATAKRILDDVSVSLYVSIISAWEIAIKTSLRKMIFNGGSTLFIETIRRNEIGLIPVKPSHLACFETLPFLHRDPFDRLLVATAKADGMTILTADENIRHYDIPTAW